jgi:hypothetical protein
MHPPRRFSRWLTCGLALLPAGLVAGSPYVLDIGRPEKTILRDHLELGGTGPGGRTVQVNSSHIERDGRPHIPIVGEFHYCRFPAAEWEESLRKMKAGGITAVATYVFWNLHERRQGDWDWSGDLDLRRFVALVDKVGLDLILRVGPFAHGEIRNGGLPDWLYGQPFEVRSNDPGYLDHADRLYAAIGEQVRGYFFKDGGPILAVQLENEFQHSAAPWDIRYAGAPVTWTVAERDVGVTHEGVSTSDVANAHAAYGRRHMAALKRLAKKNGLDAPLYTATGWGNAAIVEDGSLPVTAAYPYPFWTRVPKPSPFYLFTDLQKHPDYAPASYRTERYPSLPAELGAGISVTYARRSYVPHESVAPMIVRVLGSGSNGVGYYMYHGGATPAFDALPYHEDAGGLPRINYDYQAPLGQYGQARSHYFALRPLHLFLQSYGETLAPLPVVLPEGNELLTPATTDRLRYAARAARGSGFVFLLNFQDHVTTRDLTGLQLELPTGERTVRIPLRGDFVLKQNAHAILPVNLALGAAHLRSATVQPLTILRRPDTTHFVFFAVDGLSPELVLELTHVSDPSQCDVAHEDGAVVVRGSADTPFSFAVEGARVLVVPQSWSTEASTAPGGRLLFTPGTALQDGAEVSLLGAGGSAQDVRIYPAVEMPRVLGGQAHPLPAPHPGVSAFQIRFPAGEYAVEWQPLTRHRYVARFSQGLGEAHNVYMKIPYVGDTGMAFIGGTQVDDHFYFGRDWEIGLKRFLPRLKNGEMVFVFQPIREDASCLQDIPEVFRPRFAEGEKRHLTVGIPEFVTEYRATFQMPSSP